MYRHRVRSEMDAHVKWKKEKAQAKAKKKSNQTKKETNGTQSP